MPRLHTEDLETALADPSRHSVFFCLRGLGEDKERPLQLVPDICDQLHRTHVGNVVAQGWESGELGWSTGFPGSLLSGFGSVLLSNLSFPICEMSALGRS